ncbi:hypothetical protein DYB35_013280 [Aphanomyces astaci]|uniref:Uncharacterized protein n=1 Tax=Aphanomyces astaci TaxID=112090 RepID=A0A3R7BBQ6_APHAT|nr:hypothetical protein DYB35_013280 [Aphanomyces astaci]
MSPTYDRTTILLDDKNWSTWRTFIKGRLMGNGLIHTLTLHSFYVSSDEVAEPTYRRDTQRALGIIIELHEPQTHVDKIALLTEYHAISWEPKGETLSSFIERFQNLVRKLRDARCAEDEYMMVAKLLALMPWCLRIPTVAAVEAAEDKALVEAPDAAKGVKGTATTVAKQDTGSPNAIPDFLAILHRRRHQDPRTSLAALRQTNRYTCSMGLSPRVSV